MTLLMEFYKATVLGAIATTEYEGELKKHGDTLRIRTLPDIESRTYVKGQKLVYDSPDPGYIDLLIDKGEYWGMALNALDQKQSDIKYVQQWAEHASINQKVKIDGTVLGDIYGDVDAANKGSAAGKESGNINLGVTGTPLQLTRATILEILIENCGVVMDEQNVPDDGRFVVLPSWACALLKTSDLRDASKTGDGVSALRNGRIGMIDRFEVFCSNNLSKVTDTVQCTNAIFGHKKGTAFASQMLNTETMKNPDDFGDLMRSLQAYGYKVVKPEALGHLYIKK
jgi:hypothetical protein